jgi:glutamine synthetase
VSSKLAAALEPQRRYLVALLQGVRGELAQGKPLQEAVRDVQPQKSQWQLWDETHPRNVARAYQELEWE